MSSVGRWLRRRPIVVAVGCVVVALIVSAVLVHREPAKTRVAATVDLSSAQSTASTTTTTAPTTTLEATTTTDTTAVPAPTAPPTTRDPCRNSHDPACGPFHYDPKPSNSPARLTVTASRTNAASGEQVTFTAVLSDSDGRPTTNCAALLGEIIDPPGQDTGRNFLDQHYGCDAPVCEDTSGRYGPWDPPAREGGSITMTFTGSGSSATVRFCVTAQSEGAECANNAYGGTAEKSVDVTFT